MDNKCRKANKLINGYIDNLLNEKDKLFFENHIKQCNKCKKEYEDYILLISDIAETQYAEVPSDFSAKLHLRLAQETQKTEHKSFKLRPYINIAVSAALICAVVFGANLYEQYSSQIDEEFIIKNKAPVLTNETSDKNQATEIVTKNENDTTSTESQEDSYTKNLKTEPVAEQVLPEASVNDEIESTDTVIQHDSNMQPYYEENEPAVAPVSEQKDDMPISGGGGSSSYSAMRKIVFYAEYSVALTSKHEILEQLKSEFNITDDNALICDDNEFNTLVEFLNNNDLYLKFVQERESDNFITFK